MTEPSSLKQMICKSGHVTEIAYDSPEGLVAHVQACPRCGGAAVWYRTRPWVTVTRSGNALIDPTAR